MEKGLRLIKEGDMVIFNPDHKGKSNIRLTTGKEYYVADQYVRKEEWVNGKAHPCPQSIGHLRIVNNNGIMGSYALKHFTICAEDVVFDMRPIEAMLSKASIDGFLNELKDL